MPKLPIALSLAVFVASSAVSAKGDALPRQPDGKCVLDEAGALDAASFAELERLCEDLDRSGDGQLEVVVVNDLGDRSKEEFANDLFKKWKIGHRGVDDGLLVLLKTGVQGQRGIWVEVGYGLEGVLNDGKVGEFRDRALPRLKAGEYGPGLLEIVEPMLPLVHGEAQSGAVAKRSAVPEAQRGKSTDLSDDATAAVLDVLLGLFYVILLATFFLRHKFPGKPTYVLGLSLGATSVALNLVKGGTGSWIAFAIFAVVAGVIHSSLSGHHCPKCDQWMRVDETRMLEPTTYSTGLARVEETCTHCSYHRLYEKTLPVLPINTGGTTMGGGSSGGGGGGGGGGGFSGGGGGSSGGGGAGADF